MTSDERPPDPPDQPDQVVLDPQKLRGLAHPLRIRLLGLLRENGPSTASKLAERVGQSSGATSYHLRQLATYGFIVEDPDRAPAGRERWWKAAHRITTLDHGRARETPLETEVFGRTVAAAHYEQVESFLDGWATLPEEWDGAYTLSDQFLRLSPDEAKQLRRELFALVDRYRKDDPEVEPPPGTERVVVQLHLLPKHRDA